MRKALADYRDVRPDGVGRDRRGAVDFCTELLQNRRVSDATYARAVGLFGEEGVVQIAVIQGLYSYMSMAVNWRTPSRPNTGGSSRL